MLLLCPDVEPAEDNGSRRCRKFGIRIVIVPSSWIVIAIVPSSRIVIAIVPSRGSSS
jgi:hypothetical protein